MRGSEAKSKFIDRLKVALGSDYIGVDDTGKKWYVWSEEDGAKVQVAITLTVPKVGLDVGEFSQSTVSPTETVSKIAPMSDDEASTLERLRKELGL